MGDYGFEGAGEFGGTDFPDANDIEDMVTHLPLELKKTHRQIPVFTEYETSFTVFPQDCNYNDPPSIFGGKMLAEMDNCAAMTVRRGLYGTGCTDAVTVGVDNVGFHRPAFIGEIVHIKGKLIELGKKSVKVMVECTRENKQGEIHTMAKGVFTFVARKRGVPSEHGLEMR